MFDISTRWRLACVEGSRNDFDMTQGGILLHQLQDSSCECSAMNATPMRTTDV